MSSQGLTVLLSFCFRETRCTTSVYLDTDQGTARLVKAIKRKFSDHRPLSTQSLQSNVVFTYLFHRWFTSFTWFYRALPDFCKYLQTTGRDLIDQKWHSNDTAGLFVKCCLSSQIPSDFVLFLGFFIWLSDRFLHSDHVNYSREGWARVLNFFGL